MLIIFYGLCTSTSEMFIIRAVNESVFLWYGFNSSIRVQRIKTSREAVLRHLLCHKLSLVEYLYVSHLCVFNKKIKEMHHKPFCSFFGTSGGIS